MHSDDRGVDPAGEPDDDVGEAVLAHVVAGAQHQRLVQLGVGSQFGRDPGRWWGAIAPERCIGDVDQGHLDLGSPAAWIEQALAVHGLDVHLGDQQFFDELRGTGDERAVGIEHKRTAVEDQLVLAAHLVDIDERTACIRSPRRQHALAIRCLVEVVRRAVDVDVQFGSAGCLLGQRAGRAPHVFADADAHLHAADHIQLVRVACGARREVASLVEHRVVRQQALAICAQHRAVGAHGCGVVDVAIGVDETNDGGAMTGVRRHLGQRLEVVGDEPGLQHEILRRVPGDRQFGEGDDVAPGRLGLVVGGDDLGDVAFEVADLRVQLGESDPQAGHSVKASDQPPSK